jgi:glycosyltransferase involved in cell wall biosynthesis
VPLAVRADRCDVYLGGAFVVPRALRIPSVAVLHDCLAFRDPSAKPGAEGRYWRRWTRDAARRAARIVTVSRFVAADCERFVDADPSRIRVVYPGVGARFTPSDEPAGSIAARLSLPWPFVLHVGSFDAHKGAGAAIEAVKTVAARRGALKLARVGPAGNVDVADESVVNLGRVADATLVDLYRAASAVLVTSTHEGFGLPVLEAMACGTPVIATRAGGLPEAGGDAALYAAADAASIADALERVLAAPGEEAGRRREAGLRHVAAFSWDRAAGGVLDVLREAASR